MLAADHTDCSQSSKAGARFAHGGNVRLGCFDHFHTLASIERLRVTQVCADAERERARRYQLAGGDDFGRRQRSRKKL